MVHLNINEDVVENLSSVLTFIENKFAQTKGLFSISLLDAEKLFGIKFEDDDQKYYEIHYLLRKLGIEFLYMKKANTCGFYQLYRLAHL